VLRSTEILKSLLDDHSAGDRRNWLRLLAMNHYNDGHYLYGGGHVPEAIAAFRQAREAYTTLLDQGVPEPNDRFLAAKNLLYLARAYGERFDVAMDAGQQSLAILRKLVEEHPDNFAYATQLYLALEELGLRGFAASKWELAIDNFESARLALKLQANRWGKIVSRMVSIQTSLADNDYNLFYAYDSDPPRYAGPMREISRELFEICEKLSLLQPPSWNLRIAHAQSCLNQADFQQDDGGPLDLDLLKKAEKLWEGIHREGPTHKETRRDLVIVRRRIAEALEERGQLDLARDRRRQSLETARGYPDVFFDLAIGYASGAGLVGRVPTRLDARQLEDRRARLRAEAIAMLREATADGFHDGLRLRNEPELESLRSLPEFQTMVLDLEFPPDPFASSPAVR
jgi:tetratricopeptide (TPR) repeat protein